MISLAVFGMLQASNTKSLSLPVARDVLKVVIDYLYVDSTAVLSGKWKSHRTHYKSHSDIWDSCINSQFLNIVSITYGVVLSSWEIYFLFECNDPVLTSKWFTSQKLFSLFSCVFWWHLWFFSCASSCQRQGFLYPSLNTGGLCSTCFCLLPIE